MEVSMADDEPRMSRVQMNLPQGSVDRLDALVKRTESASYAEVMRNALKLFDGVVTELENGGCLYVKRGHAYEPVMVLGATR